MNLRKLNIDKATIPERLLHFNLIILAHLVAVELIFTGKWEELFIAYLVSLPLTHIGVSFTYHRVLTHNAVKLPKPLEWLLTIYAGMSLQGSGLSWVATHNAHHKYSGTEKDPHSPLHSHWFWIHLFGYTFREISGRHAGRLLKDKFQVFMHKYYLLIYSTIITSMYFILGEDNFIVYIVAPIAITWQLQSFANTWGHNWGANEDKPHNSWLMFPLILGDAWHKNHHDKPGDVRFHKCDPIGWLGEKLFKKK